jgi:hypothetical protein
MRFVRRFFVVAILIIPAQGCGQRPPLVPVGGVVLIGTNPVEGASVSFLSDVAGALPATGTTDAAGRFRLKTYWRSAKREIDGAATGAYRVVISKLTWPDLGGASPAESRALKVPAPMNDLPERYNSAATSGLLAEVRSGSVNDFTFVLE